MSTTWSDPTRRPTRTNGALTSAGRFLTPASCSHAHSGRSAWCCSQRQSGTDPQRRTPRRRRSTASGRVSVDPLSGRDGPPLRRFQLEGMTRALSTGCGVSSSLSVLPSCDRWAGWGAPAPVGVTWTALHRRTRLCPGEASSTSLNSVRQSRSQTSRRREKQPASEPPSVRKIARSLVWWPSVTQRGMGPTETCRPSLRAGR